MARLYLYGRFCTMDIFAWIWTIFAPWLHIPVRPTSGKMISPFFSHSKKYWCVTTNLLFWLRFIHFTIVNPFILHCFSFLWLTNKKVEKWQKDIDKILASSYYVLQMAKMHVNMIISAPVVKLLKSTMLFVVYWFKS